jgi:hypothetical protein
MKTQTFGHRLFAAFVAIVLSIGLASPAMAQNKKDKKGQGEAAKKAIEKQKDIAKGLADKAKGDPSVAQKKVDDLKTELQEEKDRHTKALETLNADLKTATDAGQSQKIKNIQKAIEKENEAYEKKIAKMQKDIDEAQAKVDGK